MQPELSQPTLREYLVPIRKRWWLIALIVVTITGVVAAYYAQKPPAYTAATEVYIGPQSDAALGIAASTPSPEAIANEAALLTSNEVAAIVARQIHYPGSAAALAASVTATPSTTTNFLDLSSTQSAPALAAQVVNAFAQEFIHQNLQSQISLDDRQIQTLRKQLRSVKGTDPGAQRQTIQQQIQQLQLANSTVVGNSTQVNVAHGAVASKKSPIKYGLLAAVGSLIGAVLLAYALERFDPRMKGIRDAEALYGQPVLATVVQDRQINYFLDRRPALSPRSREAFRDLRVALDISGGASLTYSVLVTSAIAGEGKSTIARNLAIALGETGRRVLLIDADLRSPGLSKALGADSATGLTDVVAGACTFTDVATRVSCPVMADVPGAGGHTNGNGRPATPAFRSECEFTFLAAGTTPPNPMAVFDSQVFKDLLSEVKHAFDVVVVDSSPVAVVSDAVLLARGTDCVLMVARSNTDARSARRAAEIIQRAPDATIAGVVVNAVPQSQASAYGKGYGYGYYQYGKQADAQRA